MNQLLLPIVLAVGEEEAPVEPSGVGVGSVVLTVAAILFLAWVGYLIINSRRRGRRLEETPQNLQPYLSDDELETSRVTRVLNVAVITAAVLALALPIYYINEGDRQVAAAEQYHERDVEEGAHWFESFSCVDCHGPGGSGGGAPFVEARSGLSTTWTAPSLNDVFFRYTPEEIEHWIVYGRDGTPMPSNGLEGGGAMTEQEVEQVMAYLESVQIPQGEALDEVEGLVTSALDRMARGDAAMARRIQEEQAVLADIEEAPERFAVVEDLPGEIRFLWADDGTCTAQSAGLVGSSCGSPGVDTDRDGLADVVEERLSEMSDMLSEVLVVRRVEDMLDDDGEVVRDDDGNPVTTVTTVPDPEVPNVFNMQLDPENAFSTESTAGQPVPDLERADVFLSDLDAAHLTVSVTTERIDVFAEGVETGIAFLEAAAEERLWAVDFEAVADDTGLGVEEAERAVGLFNAYCARCHTGGYSAGVIFEQEPGSGAWGPSLVAGRAPVQFPDVDDHMAFVVTGSEEAVSFGVNGLGTGRMPGFGQILSEEDIALIVAYERSL